MQVSISKAADMVGITRATFYRHIEKKGISIGKDEDGNPKVDVSELIRIYGERVKGAETQKSQKAQNDNHTETVRNRAPAMSEQIEVLQQERTRERQQLTAQIETLKASLQDAQAQQKQLTSLLNDQIKKNDNNATGAGSQKGRVKALEKTVKVLRTQNRRIIHAIQKDKSKGFWEKLFG